MGVIGDIYNCIYRGLHIGVGGGGVNVIGACLLFGKRDMLGWSPDKCGYDSGC